MRTNQGTEWRDETSYFLKCEPPSRMSSFYLSINNGMGVVCIMYTVSRPEAALIFKRSQFFQKVKADQS